jgi:uncharacterized lipoprotein YajG
MRIIYSALLGLFVLAVSSACALTTETIQLDYSPRTGVPQVQQAETVTALVSVSDTRSRTDRVSSKKNGYGMEMAAITSQNDPVSVVRQAIEAELRGRGFQIGQSGATVKTEVQKYYCDFKNGFFSGDAVAEVTLSVQVLTSGGAITYASVIAGEGKEPNVQLASGGNAKLALDRALQDAMDKLFGNQAFLDALLKARAT